MFFKNVLVYQSTRHDLFSKLENIEECLKEFSFKELGAQDISKFGWVSALPQGELMAHIVDGRILLAMKEERKVLPAKEISKQLNKRVDEIELEQGRKLRKKEKDALKEDIVMQLLPRAFVDEKTTYAYLSPKQNTLVVNTSSANAAESLIALLRKTLGSLPVVPAQTKGQLDALMTDWLVEQKNPEYFTITHNAKFSSALKGGGKITVKEEDLFSEPVHNHVSADKFVTEIGLKTDDLSFTLTEQLQLKGIDFSNVLQEQNEDIDKDDFAARFDADFALMAGILDETIKRLFEVLSVVEMEG